MSKLNRLIIALSLSGLALSAVAGTWYGKEAEPGSEPVPVSEVMNDPEAWLDQSVMVSGRITDVCTHRGCWAVLEDDGQMLRIQTLDHAFAMPSDARSMARAHGVFERLDNDGDADPESDEPEFSYRLDARGIYIE